MIDALDLFARDGSHNVDPSDDDIRDAFEEVHRHRHDADSSACRVAIGLHNDHRIIIAYDSDGHLTKTLYRDPEATDTIESKTYGRVTTTRAYAMYQQVMGVVRPQVEA